MKVKNGQEKPRFFYLVPGTRSHRFGNETRWQYLKRLLFRGKSQVPVGGVKVIYQHCDLLNRNGYKAYPVHLGDFRVNWFPHETSPISEKDVLSFSRESDILVCPEIIPKAAEAFSCKRKIAFIQNWSLTQIGTGPDKSYEDYGFTNLLVCSHYIQGYMKDRSKLPCAVVINGIDLDVFRNLPERKIPRKVLYLNRKNVDDGRKAIRFLEQGIRKTAKFVELENRFTQDQIAGIYQEADIFMALGYPEGFALPPLEAMASGCAVIGFTGNGGTEHMIDGKTALIAPDGDTEALSHCLKRVLTNEEIKEEIRMGGLEKAQEFSLERMEGELLAFASSFY